MPFQASHMDDEFPWPLAVVLVIVLMPAMVTVALLVAWKPGRQRPVPPPTPDGPTGGFPVVHRGLDDEPGP